MADRLGALLTALPGAWTRRVDEVTRDVLAPEGASPVSTVADRHIERTAKNHVEGPDEMPAEAALPPSRTTRNEQRGGGSGSERRSPGLVVVLPAWHH